MPRLLCRGVPSELGLLRAAAPLLSAVQAYVEARPVWPASHSRGHISDDWPRLAEDGGHPELDLTLAGRIKAGGQIR